jgi:hypothetical protein
MAQNPEVSSTFPASKNSGGSPPPTSPVGAVFSTEGSDSDCLELRRCPLRSLLLPGLLGLLNRLQRIGLEPAET